MLVCVASNSGMPLTICSFSLISISSLTGASRALPYAGKSSMPFALLAAMPQKAIELEYNYNNHLITFFTLPKLKDHTARL